MQFPPIKKSMHQALKEAGSVYSNQIVKPIKKKPNPKLTMNMAGLGYANSQLKAGVNFGSNDPRNG